MKNSSFPILASLIGLGLLLVAPIHAEWAPRYLYLILLAGPLIFVSWGIRLFPVLKALVPTYYNRLLIVAQLFLLASFCLPRGWLAGALGIPWFAVVIAHCTLVIAHRHKFPLALLWAFLSLPIAAAWMLADRLDWQPLGFDPMIVLLTGIHFHYAGFALAIITAALPPGKWKKTVSTALIPGVTGVATGITATQLEGPAWIEILGVSVMVIVGLSIAILQIQSAIRQKLPFIKRLLLTSGSIALASGLSLALLYGWRFHFQWSWLTIPWMYATHGLLNSLGFTTLSFLALTPQLIDD